MKNVKFVQILIGLEDFLRNSDAPIVNMLQPGNQENELAEKFKGLDLPQEVWQLYRWHNGTNSQNMKIGQSSLIRLGTFMSIERALDCYSRFAGVLEFWDVDKFPLFESRGGEYFLIDTNPTSSTYGMIFYYHPTAVDFRVIISKYDSLQSLFWTTLVCFRQKACYYAASTGYLTFDRVKELKICSAENPRSAYYKLLGN